MDSETSLSEKGYCVVELTPEHDIVGRKITSRYTIVALCISGSVEYEMNLETVKATAGMRITFTHVSMLTTLSMSDDFRAIVLVMDDNFAFESVVGIETEKIRVIFNNSQRVVDNPDEWQLLLSLMNALLQYQNFPTTGQSPQVGSLLFRSIVLVLSENEASASGKAVVCSATDTYFRNFINLLNDYVRTQHEVAFYAEQLHISAKYLGEICKLKSGRKAKEIISAVLIAQLKREIVSGGKSLKVIAYDYGFSDQSSLGKFFRKMVGVSPLAFKRQNYDVEVI